MWRIGQLARIAGVSDRTLRHYDKIGLLPPAAVDAATGYRWYGTAELTRLERIRALRRLGLSLRQIADLADAPDTDLRRALADTAAALRREITDRTATLAATDRHLARPTTILVRETRMAARRIRVRRLRVAHPAELRDLCPAPPATLLTWLTGFPAHGFTAAVTTGRDGEVLTLPARDVVRAHVPPGLGVVRAGQELFDLVRHQHLTVAGPTVEDHLSDADGARVTVLEIPVSRR
jgi:DNA-binding transcriptional MerR regulator